MISYDIVHYTFLDRKEPYFMKEHSNSNRKFTEDGIIYMLEFLVDKIFVVFGGKVFQQIIGIPMDTNCVRLLSDIFLYPYEAAFIQSVFTLNQTEAISISVHLPLLIRQ